MSKEHDKKDQMFENTVLGVLPAFDLKTLGLDAVAYVKSYQMNGQTTWVLHAADGTAVSVQEDVADAINSARHQQLEIVAVH